MNGTLGSTVLIVEDEPGTAILQQRRLERAGYRVTSVPTVEQAMARVREGDVELVVLDYRLAGGVTGLDFYEQLKAAGFDLPVIIVTGYSSESTAVEALRAGVRDFVVKTQQYLDYLPTAVDRALDQVHLEQELTASRTRLSGIVRTAMDAIITTDRQGVILEFNPAAEKMFGHPVANALGRNVIDLVVPDPLRERCRRGWERRETGASPVVGRRVEFPALRADGTTFPVELAVTETIVKGAPVFTGFVRDLTERKRAEEAIRRSEERYRRIVDTAGEGIWTVNAAGVTTFVNQRLAALLGYTVEEMIDAPLARFARETDWAEPGYAPAPARGGAGPPDYQLHRKDGGVVWVIISSARLYDDESRDVGCLAMVTDITARKRLEEQFQQSQKMEVVGQLAGGVAHDFNNLLTIILGYSEMLREGGIPPELAKDCLAQITRAGERGAALTHQLLAFSRKQIIAPVVLDPNALIANLEKMLRRMVPESIAFAVDLSPDVGRVRADPGQLEQVLMNLVANARDAMPRGGNLRIETRNAVLREPKKNTNGGGGEIPPGAYLVLSVRDDGMGMAAPVLARIFEPFFTTKPIGKGTGLGLATAFGVVISSGGLLEAESELGRGSTFRIYLPLVQSEIRPQDAIRPANEIPRGGETVLLVEDEDAVRNFARTVLQAAGYAVLEAHEGEEAMRLAGAHAGPIHLLVTDVVMPGVGGVQLATGLQAARAGLKVLYLSGYTEDAAALQELLATGFVLLSKPFTLQQLASKVREVLDG